MKGTRLRGVCLATFLHKFVYHCSLTGVLMWFGAFRGKCRLQDSPTVTFIVNSKVKGDQVLMSMAKLVWYSTDLSCMSHP